ncbi:MAG: tetratricopeptide repeat protein [Desulfovibrionaceae bacterium]|nr:tetratricopeptide repeat protein [Desulfovibrionaceae bacterium]
MAEGTHSSQNSSGSTSIHGVFSSQEVRKVGTGTTTRKSVHKTFWFVEQHDDEIVCQPLNTHYVPSGPKRTITLDELLAKFAPEPEFYQSSVFPKMQQLNKKIEEGDEHREKGETFSAEHEYQNALKIDCDNVRANFGIGLTYLERGDKSKAQNIFDRLVKLEGAFEEEHKHLFNEFGIQLRKNNMVAEALAYYGRAIEITKTDENLYLNMARAQFENHDIDKCLENLFLALRLAPTHDVSIKFLGWLLHKRLVPEERRDEANRLLSFAQQIGITPTAQIEPVAPSLDSATIDSLNQELPE